MSDDLGGWRCRDGVGFFGAVCANVALLLLEA